MATTTTATTTHVAFKRPKDDMKSTWRAQPRKDQTYFQRVITTRGMYHQSLDKEVPVHPKTDKIPALPEWQVNRWILYHAAIPMAIHQAFVSYTGLSVHPIIVAVGYSFCMVLTGIHELNVMRFMAYRYGFLDGDKKRDDVPDHSVMKTVVSLGATVISRIIMMTILCYRGEPPAQTNWAMLPVAVAVYGVTLDFWFYWYHRIMHHNEFFWKFHRTHHLTKHPTALLTEYADEEQEVLDMVGIPLLTFTTLKLLGLPLDFYSWWLCTNYLVYTELVGHSGLRVHSGTVSPVNFILRYFECELVIEDHDLHHRKGWKKSHNYGKQTRLWDRLFGTVGERIESAAGNVDWVNTARWPIFW